VLRSLLLFLLPHCMSQLYEPRQCPLLQPKLVCPLCTPPLHQVMEALQSAGLHQTDYARHMILTATPAKPTRPDNLTAVQRGVA